MREMDKTFNKDEYDRIRSQISFRINEFVNKFRKVLFEKKKNVTKRGLNS
jgi:hypothetical protein